MRSSARDLSKPAVREKQSLSFFILGPILLFVLAAAALLRFQPIPSEARDYSPDEMIYTTYANVVAHEGVRGTAISVEQYNLNPKLWPLPPPTRIGYLYPLAGLMRLKGRSDIDVGIHFSRILSGLSLVLLVLFAVRFFGVAVALAALILMALSPIELVIAQRTWQDGLMAFLGGLMIWLGCEIARNPQRKIFYLLYFLLGIFSLLVKESGLVMLGLCTGLVLIVLIQNKHKIHAAALLAIAFLSALAALFLCVYACGGLAGFLELFRHLTEAVPQNDYAATFQQGSWYSLWEGLWILSPLTLLLAGVSLAIIFLSRAIKNQWVSRVRERVVYWAGLALFVVCFVWIASTPNYFKNLRYISPVFIPYYLLAGGGAVFILSTVWQSTKGLLRWGIRLIVLSIFVIALWGDHQRYRVTFIDKKTKDLSVELIKAKIKSPEDPFTFSS